jgi:hypothetical protein
VECLIKVRLQIDFCRTTPHTHNRVPMSQFQVVTTVPTTEENP